VQRDQRRRVLRRQLPPTNDDQVFHPALSRGPWYVLSPPLSPVPSCFASTITSALVFLLHYHQCPRVSPPLSPVPSCFSSTITCAFVFLFSFPPPRPFLCIQCMCTTIVRVYIRTRARTYTRQGADNEPEQSDLRRPGNGRSLGAPPEWPWAACHFAL